MIFTLLFTIVVETLAAAGYGVYCRKPVRPILITSLCANLITQALLWGLLNLFYQNYLVTLGVAEALIWILEALALYYVPANQLRLNEALLLSLGMNLLSFGLGLFLPI